MTEIYQTPKVLHIQEMDVDGNKRIVRYYREDTIDNFVSKVCSMLTDMRCDSDKYGEREE